MTEEQMAAILVGWLNRNQWEVFQEVTMGDRVIDVGIVHLANHPTVHLSREAIGCSVPNACSVSTIAGDRWVKASSGPK